MIDYKKARFWLEKAAEKVSYPPYCFYLGKMYELGHGGPVDYVKAVKWYQKAANQGDEESIKALRKLKTGE